MYILKSPHGPSPGYSADAETPWIYAADQNRPGDLGQRNTALTSHSSQSSQSPRVTWSVYIRAELDGIFDSFPLLSLLSPSYGYEVLTVYWILFYYLR